MNINKITDNIFLKDSSSVWLLKNHKEFDYSDGTESEEYLKKVFNSVEDLSCRSSELPQYIKDWPSEYHLTVNRSQLFAGFEFDSTLKVLEVGCGCGAITRYLGETFSDVVSIEGSLSRAKLARLRTKDLDGVSIICAPFQEIKFTRKFDVIFCIGVYEYSASFVDGTNPYDTVLSYFNEMLTDKGVVVIAIENQFGLKYFSSSREDHTGRKYEGLEGYHRQNIVRTFGRKELEKNLSKYFPKVDFYYPYPDYKIPSCILSHEFLSSEQSGELVSQIKSRDYSGKLDGLWNESSVTLELSKNKMLPFFSNSFLVFAGKNESKNILFNQLAVFLSSKRRKEFTTLSRVYKNSKGAIRISKKILSKKPVALGDSNLSLIETSSDWISKSSLQTILFNNCVSQKMPLDSIFEPCQKWVTYLEDKSKEVNSTKYLDGSYVDSIWSNTYLSDTGIKIIDREWVWGKDIKLNVLVIRAIFTHLSRMEDMTNISNYLKGRSLKRKITLIAKSFGINFDQEDFDDFILLETEFQEILYDSANRYSPLILRWYLNDSPSLSLARQIKAASKRISRRIINIYKNNR